MNENVTNKTPKRRRWIARLLVSALCILLASSLLFVGVVADNIELVAQFTSFFPLDVSSAFGFYYLDAAHCVYSSSNALYFCGPNGTLSSLPLTFSHYPSFYRAGDVLYCSFVEASSSLGRFPVLIEIDISDLSSPFVIRSRSLSSIQGYVTSSMESYISFCIYDGLFVGFCYTGYTSEQKNFCRAFVYSLDNGENYFVSSAINLTFGVGSDFELISNSCFVQDGLLISLLAGKGLSLNTNSFLLSFDSEYSSVFFYDGLYYVLGETNLYSYNSSLRTFEVVGVSPLVPLCAFASNGALYCVSSLGSNSRLPYTVFSGLPTTEPPPESSDETTTEPPPESSEDSSEPSSALTNVWKVDRGFKEALAGSIDLSGATRIRAFLGVFTSSGSSFASDRAVPLTIEVYRNGLDSPDVYTFDFFAYGWGATSNGFPNSYDSYTFPDVVGLYYDIPIPADGEGLLFPTFAPYGSIYVNFSDSVFPDDIQRVTFNLYNSQGYLDVNFASSTSTSFTIYNDDLTKGKTYTFDSGTFNYKCFFDLDGEYSETEWFSPQFGSSIKYAAEDVLESGLYAIFSFNDDSIEYPWGNGEWSEAISNANSRLDQVSLDYEILESKANEAYGQFSFNSMTGQDFIGAVSNFESIKDSSGGSYILDYFFGMWNVHPFASSMIAIVGTLAIVGFIIRKL